MTNAEYIQRYLWDTLATGDLVTPDNSPRVAVTFPINPADITEGKITLWLNTEDMSFQVVRAVAATEKNLLLTAAAYARAAKVVLDLKLSAE